MRPTPALAPAQPHQRLMVALAIVVPLMAMLAVWTIQVWPASAAGGPHVVNTLETGVANPADFNPGDSICDADSDTIGNQCTLTAAIQEANAAADADEIRFADSITTIAKTAASNWNVTSRVTIDGFAGRSGGETCAYATRLLTVVLDGSTNDLDGAGISLLEGADDSVIRGLVIQGFNGFEDTGANGDAGILVEEADRVTIECNNIGTNAAGDSATATTANFDGIHVIGAADDMLVGALNVISGNLDDGLQFVPNGSLVAADGATVIGNRFGTSFSTLVDLGNGDDGLAAEGATNLIVGSLVGGNVFSGNGENGILLQGVAGATVSHNYVGISGLGAAIQNDDDGIDVEDSSDVTIGPANTVSGNDDDGIQVMTSSGVTIIGNTIGMSPDGMTAVPNLDDGIVLQEDADAPAEDQNEDIAIGGNTVESRNIIAGNNGDGIRVEVVSGLQIAGNYIGLRSDGTAIPESGNGSDGIDITPDGDLDEWDPFVTDLVIGGPTANHRNYIANNAGNGIELYLTDDGDPFEDVTLDVAIANNYIGLDAAGNPAGNGYNGIGVYLNGNSEGPDNADVVITIGFIELTEIVDSVDDIALGANVISANGLAGDPLEGHGIFISEDYYTSAIGILDNLIGVNPDGNAEMGYGNALDGINLFDSEYSFIGALLLAPDIPIPPDQPMIAADHLESEIVVAGNVISNNGRSGIQYDYYVDGSLVLANHIGVALDGVTPAGNGGNGITVIAATGEACACEGFGPVTIGFEHPDEETGNIIANNTGDGVYVGWDEVEEEPAYGVTISANSIYANGGLGINLEDNAPDIDCDLAPPTANCDIADVHINDPFDDDDGPNGLQNSIVITGVSTGDPADVEFTFDSFGSDYRVEFFANEVCDPSGYGEGETFLSSTVLIEVPPGPFSGSAEVIGWTDEMGEFITATVTDLFSGDTSEFSNCQLGAPREQTLQFFQPVVSALNPAAPIPLSASGKDAETGAATFAPISYTILTPGACVVDVPNNTLILLTPGTCTISAQAQAIEGYLASNIVTHDVLKLNQSLVFNTPPTPASNVNGGTVFQVKATGGLSTAPVVITFAGACTPGAESQIPGNNTSTAATTTRTLTAGASGTCIATANQAATPYFNAATQIQKTITIQAKVQVIMHNLPFSVRRNVTFGVWASTHDNMTNALVNPQPTITLQSLTPAICQVLPPANPATQKGQVKTLATGQCIIRVNAGASGAYGATSTQRVITVTP